MDIKLTGSLLHDIYDGPLKPLWIDASSRLYPEAEAVTARFYARLTSEPEILSTFHAEELADRHESFVEWTRSLFVPERSSADLDAFLGKQVTVGRAHVHRSVPLAHVNWAAQVLKSEIGEVLKASDLPRDKLADAVLLTGLVVDDAIGKMTDAFVEETTDMSVAMGHRSALAGIAAQDFDAEPE